MAFIWIQNIHVQLWKLINMKSLTRPAMTLTMQSTERHLHVYALPDARAHAE